jgi:mannose-6-phosphate isomerase-like protein (cupin superfamily)
LSAVAAATRAEPSEGRHGGKRSVALLDVLSKVDFHGYRDIVDRVVIPAGSSIDDHRRGDDEEMYIVLKGSAMMTLDGKTFRVREGDMMLNAPRRDYGLVNDTGADIELLIIQVR